VSRSGSRHRRQKTCSPARRDAICRKNDADVLDANDPARRPVMEVVVCRTGMARHAPGLAEALAPCGAKLDTVECFDRCEACERALLARIDGATLRFRDAAELLEAVASLRAER
jgi:hypothetical protein